MCVCRSTKCTSPESSIDTVEEGVVTILKGFQRSVKRIPNSNFLGTRDEKQEGRPYKWKTYSEADEISTALAKGKPAV